VNIYLLERDEDSVDLYLPDEQLTLRAIENGLDTVCVRNVLLHAQAERGEIFEIASDRRKSKGSTDLFFWAWVPVLSRAAYEVMLNQGAEDADFLECAVKDSMEKFFFLPENPLNAINVERSTFSYAVPVSPPLPWGAIKVVLNPGHEEGPPMFFTKPHSSLQVSPDVYVRDRLVSQWEAHGLRGAKFKKVN